jgi:hypothetical protein
LIDSLLVLDTVLTEDFKSSDVWAQEEMDTLYWYYVQSKKCPDVVGNIINQIKESQLKTKSRIAVIQQLLQQDIITLKEFDDLMKFEDSQYEREAKFSGSDGTQTKEEPGVEISENSDTSAISIQVDDIKVKSLEAGESLEVF